MATCGGGEETDLKKEPDEPSETEEYSTTSQSEPDTLLEEDENEEWECAGLEAINRACDEAYPDGRKQFQKSAVTKYWSVFLIINRNL